MIKYTITLLLISCLTGAVSAQTSIQSNPKTHKTGDSDPVLMKDNDERFHVGATGLFGYNALYIVDESNPAAKIRETYHGVNASIAGGVQYDLCPVSKIEGRVRLFEFTQNTGTQDAPPFSTVKTTHRFYQMGLDVNAYWEFCNNLYLFGGPAVTFNLATATKFSASYLGLNFNLPYTKNLFQSNVMAGFNLGFMYEIPVGDFVVQPFVTTRLPFNRSLRIPSQKNYPFTFDVGATFNFFDF